MDDIHSNSVSQTPFLPLMLHWRYPKLYINQTLMFPPQTLFQKELEQVSTILRNPPVEDGFQIVLSKSQKKKLAKKKAIHDLYLSQGNNGSHPSQ